MNQPMNHGPMKAHKPLDWERLPSNAVGYRAGRDYFITPYRDRSMWLLQGDGIEVVHADVNELKQRAQDHYNRKHQLKAWEDYMLTHDPPEAADEIPRTALPQE